MASVSVRQDIQQHIPFVGDIGLKTSLAYQMTRAAVKVVNTIQLGSAESYINGQYLMVHA